jgi:hypothetical protein
LINARATESVQYWYASENGSNTRYGKLILSGVWVVISFPTDVGGRFITDCLQQLSERIINTLPQ